MLPDDKEYQKHLVQVTKNADYMKFLPEKYKTKELCDIAVKENPVALKYVPEDMITPDLCESVVKENGYNLKDVPFKHRTEEICEMAIKDNGYALRYVPSSQRTFEICDAAFADVRADNDKWKDLCLFLEEEVPEDFQDEIAEKNDFDMGGGYTIPRNR